MKKCERCNGFKLLTIVKSAGKPDKEYKHGQSFTHTGGMVVETMTCPDCVKVVR